MTYARTYISTRDLGGRLVIVRSDGQVITPDEKAWFDKAVTDKIRSEKLIAAKSAAVPMSMDEDEADNLVHPMLITLRSKVNDRGFDRRMGELSALIGRRKTALSEWLRGLAKPYFVDVYALFGLLGYRLVAVPMEILDTVLDQVQTAETETRAKDRIDSMGDGD